MADIRLKHFLLLFFCCQHVARIGILHNLEEGKSTINNLSVDGLKLHTEIFHLIIIGLYSYSTLLLDDAFSPARETRVLQHLSCKIAHAPAAAAPRCLYHSPLHLLHKKNKFLQARHKLHVALQMGCGPLARTQFSYLLHGFIGGKHNARTTYAEQFLLEREIPAPGMNAVHRHGIGKYLLQLQLGDKLHPVLILITAEMAHLVAGIVYVVDQHQISIVSP